MSQQPPDTKHVPDDQDDWDTEGQFARERRPQKMTKLEFKLASSLKDTLIALEHMHARHPNSPGWLGRHWAIFRARWVLRKAGLKMEDGVEVNTGHGKL